MKISLLIILYLFSLSLKEEQSLCFPSLKLITSERKYNSNFFRLDSTPSDRENLFKRSINKKRQQEIIRSPEGVPSIPIAAERPSVYKPVYKEPTKNNNGKRLMNQGKPREREIANPNRLRIIGGIAKGKKIDSPDVYLRPMMAKVREAVFSSLNYVGLFQSNTTKVLDMFAGSGSVGLEALSRGASHTTFVDMSDDCVQTALRNARHCGFQHQVSAVCAKAEEVLSRPGDFGLPRDGLPYQLVSITPPYQEVVYSELINAVCESPLVGPDTIVLIEYPVEMGSLPFVLGGDKLFGLRNRKYGRTVLAMYVFRPSRQIEMRPEEFAQ